MERGTLIAGSARSLAAELVHRLGAGALEASPARSGRRVELDTIERALERAGAWLTWEEGVSGGVLTWTAADGRNARLELAAPPAFAFDLQPGPLRQALGKAAGVRRLLALREVERSERELRRLDARGKTVARLIELCERFRMPGASGEWSPERAALVSEPVRGYEVEHAALMVELGALDVPVQDPAAAREARPAPGLPFAFDPPAAWPAIRAREPAALAARRIAQRQLELARSQESGLRADLDTEFTHDLRVAVRRARAILSQLARPLESLAVEGLRQQLAWLGRRSGPLRDGDVLGLELRELEGDLADPLQPLAELVDERRRCDRADLIAALDSPQWTELQAAWQDWAESEPPGGGPTFGTFAAQRIARLRQRALREGARLGADAPVEALHALRIQCKKLRYLIECAQDPAAQDQRAACASSLKGLQEVLGEIHDAHLQAARLEAWAQPLAERAPRALLPLGRLIERRQTAERAGRARFAERFARFAARGAREEFEVLCAALREGGASPP